MKKYAIVLFSVCFTYFISGLPAQAAPDSVKGAMTAKEIQFRASMNSLFTQCLDRQRSLDVKTLAGANDTDDAMIELAEIMEDIGDVFKAYYGENKGGQITRLLKQYFQMPPDFADFERQHEDATPIQRDMLNKSDEIADLFDTFSPAWLNSGLSEALKGYSDMIIQEIEIQNQSYGKPNANIFSQTHDKNIELAKTFSSGIIKQFPERFRQ
jgi:hypothetical protein